jgi:hypothetical protein
MKRIDNKKLIFLYVGSNKLKETITAFYMYFIFISYFFIYNLLYNHNIIHLYFHIFFIIYLWSIKVIHYHYYRKIILLKIYFYYPPTTKHKIIEGKVQKDLILALWRPSKKMCILHYHPKKLNQGKSNLQNLQPRKK